MKEVTLKNYREDKYYTKLVCAVTALLGKSGVVRPIDVFREMGMLEQKNLVRWQNGQVAYLERVLDANLSKADRVLRLLRFHAHDLNLKPSVTVYKKGKIKLHFSKTGKPQIEEAYSRHFVKLGRPSVNNKSHCTLDCPAPKNCAVDQSAVP